VVESEGNGRMCVTLPPVLISLIGIEKIVPSFADLEVFLQTLPRSATGERMNPYNSIWTGTTRGDGPQEFHVVLLDNGRTNVLANAETRETLHCIRCAACLNACPVYRQTGGHAYGSIYSGPIGAILTPQLQSMEHSRSLPYASSLCGACFEVCPVKINIPEILIELRREIVAERAPVVEGLAMKAAAMAFASGTTLGATQKVARVLQRPFVRDGAIRSLPGLLGGWTETRDLSPIPPVPRVVGEATQGARIVSGSRDEILARIRHAVGNRAGAREEDYAAIPRGYRSDASLDPSGRVALFLERLGDYQVAVHRCTRAAIAATVGAVLGAHGKRRLVHPPDLDPAWLPAGFDFAPDFETSYAALDASEGVITACTLGIAFTGSLVLCHGRGEGRRALTLVPDYHLCVIGADQIVETVPEAIRRLHALGPRVVTTIAGPSATADIEMTRIRGVHGPRTLEVIAATD
jgi:L-lactate dehydrogenase complex protein LldF